MTQGLAIGHYSRWASAQQLFVPFVLLISLCPTFCRIIWGGECRFCPRHTDRFFSGFLDPYLQSSPHLLPLWGRNAKEFMATTQQTGIRRMLSRQKGAPSQILWDIFANILFMQQRALPCVPGRSILREKRGSACLFKASCKPGSRHCRGVVPTFVSEKFPANLGWLWK